MDKGQGGTSTWYMEKCGFCLTAAAWSSRTGLKMGVASREDETGRNCDIVRQAVEKRQPVCPCYHAHLGDHSSGRWLI